MVVPQAALLFRRKYGNGWMSVVGGVVGGGHGVEGPADGEGPQLCSSGSGRRAGVEVAVVGGVDVGGAGAPGRLLGPAVAGVGGHGWAPWVSGDRQRLYREGVDGRMDVEEEGEVGGGGEGLVVVSKLRTLTELMETVTVVLVEVQAMTWASPGLRMMLSAVS